MKISLNQFAREHDINPGTVYRKCQALGIKTNDGLDDGAIAQLKAEFNIEPVATAPTEAPLPGQLTIFVETPSPGSLAAPTLPQEFSLSTLHTSNVQAIEDPLAVATQFLQVADQIQTAMESDIQAKEAKIQATRMAKAQIVERAQELKLEQRFYKERAKQADSVLTDETSDLQKALNLLQNLGKQPSQSAA